MARILRKKKVDTQVEKDIITGLITSTSFCRDALPLIDKDFFRLGYAKNIVVWIDDYYKEFNEAPLLNIQKVFDVEKEGLKEEDQRVIESFLDDLSGNYQENEIINKDFLLRRTIRYFDGRNLEILSENLKDCVLSGKKSAAKEFINKFHQIEMQSSEWYDPFDDSEVDAAFQDESENKLFRFPGALGSLFGDFERGWLVAFMGPPKRGKSVWLKEMGQRALQAGLRVAEINLEMSKTQNKIRTYTRLTGRAKPGMGSNGATASIPVFDCKRNQDGSCKRKQKMNDVRLAREAEMAGDGYSFIYTPDLKYRPCDYCRKENKRTAFEPVIWYVERKIKEIKRTNVKEKTRQQKFIASKKMFCKSYPAFSANLDTIEADLDKLQEAENFIPDMIIIDYADILAPENSSMTERQAIDVTWKRLKRLSEERGVLVVTASQSNRQSIEQKNVKQTNTAEDIRKLNHVDAMFSINQTLKEKKGGYVRMGVMIHRHKDFDEVAQITVLQKILAGQVILDSARIINNYDSEE